LLLKLLPLLTFSDSPTFLISHGLPATNTRKRACERSNDHFAIPPSFQTPAQYQSNVLEQVEASDTEDLLRNLTMLPPAII
jgi:hypothetical protein